MSRFRLTSLLRWMSLISLVSTAGDGKREQFTEGESTCEEIKNKLRQNFDSKIVRKDSLQKISTHLLTVLIIGVIVTIEQMSYV